MNFHVARWINIILILIGSQSFADSVFCTQKLLNRGGIQLEIWSLRLKGADRKARELESELERSLKYDRMEIVDGLEEGTTESWKVQLKSGVQAIWKPISQMGDDDTGVSPLNEVAASRLDRLFKLDTVPLTELRKQGRKNGSLQVFLPELKNGFDRGSTISPNAWFLNFLINYSDAIRSRFMDKRDNYLVLTSRRQALIDNAEAFFAEFDNDIETDTLKLWDALILYPLRKKKIPLSRIQISRSTWSRLQTVTDDEIRSAVIDLLPAGAIERVIARRKLYLGRMSRYR